MKRLLLALGLLLFPGVASAAPIVAPCTQAGPVANSECDPVNKTNPMPVIATPYTASTVALTASATGTTGATTATLAAAVGKTTFICGFDIGSTATAGVAGNATVTGAITGTLNFEMGTGVSPAVVHTTQTFNPCVPASATNTALAVVSAAPGTGGVISVTAWGYQQ